MTPAVVKNADPAFAEKALSLQPVRDRSRVYFLAGHYLPVSTVWGPVDGQYPMDVYVNSTQVGSLNADNVLVFDLPSGTYEVSWMIRSEDIIDKKAQRVSKSLRMSNGDVFVLQADYDHGPSATFGLIGAAISPPKTYVSESRKSLKGKTVVLPQSCPETLCLK